MKRKMMVLGCLLIAGFCITHGVLAEEALLETGFSGYLSLVSGMIGTTSNFYAFEGRNFSIDNLDSELEDDINQGFFNLVGEVRYRFGSGQQIYLGVPFDERNPRRFASNEVLSLGVVHPFGDFGRIDFSLFSSSETVWENPYLTGEDRIETDALAYGVVVDYDGVWGTSLNLLYKLKRKDMEGSDDVIGTLYSDLQREGYVHTIETEYDFLPSRRHMITPGLVLERGDMDGKSNAYAGCSAKLVHTWDRDDIVLNSSISVGTEIFDETHPLFDKKRKDNVYTMGFGMTLLGSLGLENVFVHGNLNLEARDSNIDFCDAKKMISFIAVGYNF